MDPAESDAADDLASRVVGHVGFVRPPGPGTAAAPSRYRARNAVSGVSVSSRASSATQWPALPGPARCSCGSEPVISDAARESGIRAVTGSPSGLLPRTPAAA